VQLLSINYPVFQDSLCSRFLQPQLWKSSGRWDSCSYPGCTFAHDINDKCWRTCRIIGICTD
jgi:hypothetical protein